MNQAIDVQKEEHEHTSDEKLAWWGYGEWVEEPDIVEFTYKGYRCLIRRVASPEPSKIFHMFGGHLCGYVNIPESSSLSKKGWGDIDLDCHCGITYNDFRDFSSYGLMGHWVGFDCAHSGDFVPSAEFLKKSMPRYIDPFPLPEEFRKYSIFNPVYRNIQFCIDTCLNMVEQLIKIQQGSTDAPIH